MEDIQPTGAPSPATVVAGQTPPAVVASSSSSPVSKIPVTTFSDVQDASKALPTEIPSESTVPLASSKYNWTLVTKAKTTAVAIPLEALPGDSLAAKKEHAFRLIPADFGVTHFGPKRSTILQC
jgi:hypothetical protein